MYDPVKSEAICGVIRKGWKKTHIDMSFWCRSVFSILFSITQIASLTGTLLLLSMESHLLLSLLFYELRDEIK